MSGRLSHMKNLTLTIFLCLLFLAGFTGPAWAMDCLDACQSGLTACERDCPRSVYDSESGKTLQRTDAERLCQRACGSGHAACQRDCRF